MIIYNTIATENDDIKLNIGVDADTGKFYMPSIEFCNIKSVKYPEQTVFWDNDKFIFEKFYRFLKRFDKNELKKKDEKKFLDVWNELNVDVVKDLINILDRAKQLGWYDNK